MLILSTGTRLARVPVRNWFGVDTMLPNVALVLILVFALEPATTSSFKIKQVSRLCAQNAFFS
jgi:hypothetical protein